MGREVLHDRSRGVPGQLVGDQSRDYPRYPVADPLARPGCEPGLADRARLDPATVGFRRGSVSQPGGGQDQLACFTQGRCGGGEPGRGSRSTVRQLCRRLARVAGTFRLAGDPDGYRRRTAGNPLPGGAIPGEDCQLQPGQEPDCRRHADGGQGSIPDLRHRRDQHS
ncbi:hypothetical protein D9M71_657460 [compost metagenome]